MDLTNEIWTPKPRWTPAHSKQMKIPNFGDAHCGFGAEQSRHFLFSPFFWRRRSFLLVSGSMDMMVVVNSKTVLVVFKMPQNSLKISGRCWNNRICYEILEYVIFVSSLWFVNTAGDFDLAGMFLILSVVAIWKVWPVLICVWSDVCRVYLTGCNADKISTLTIVLVVIRRRWLKFCFDMRIGMHTTSGDRRREIT